MIKRLRLQNLTVFANIDLELAEGVNVFVGGNATGKTHLIKVLYSLEKARSVWAKLPEERAEVEQEIVEAWGQVMQTFTPEREDQAYRGGSTFLEIEGQWTDGAAFLGHYGRSEPPKGSVGGFRKAYRPPVFIPSKDVLGHSVGFRSLYKLREIDFDQTYSDLLDAVTLNPLREKNGQRLLSLIEEIIGGRVVVEGDRFYIDGQNQRLEMHLVAEGWRKLAVLYLLIQNGSLGPERVLLWDEPEANLNPSYMRDVVEILLSLAREGTQVFLATHNYVILKELDLQSLSENKVKYFGLEATSEGTVVHQADDFTELKPNLILDEYDSLFIRDLQRGAEGSAR